MEICREGVSLFIDKDDQRWIRFLVRPNLGLSVDANNDAASKETLHYKAAHAKRFISLSFFDPLNKPARYAPLLPLPLLYR